MANHASAAMTFAALAAALGAAAPALAAPSPFDGAWKVTLSCPASEDGKALGYAYEFLADVADGDLHGERGKPDEPGWLRLEGPIAADGSANLTAEGLTNNPNYALYNVRKSTRFKRLVQARFERDKGSGTWTTVRTCTFSFTRR